ncbi:MAG: glycine cleavage system protein GcvH [Rhabdochlamydiaceae bacterium]|jgi:glycine cleavage system H protein
MLKFTDSHEWIQVDGDIGVVGITTHAQQELGEIVYLELPTIGKCVAMGEEACVLESTKAAADIYSPVSGEVVDINTELKETTEKINQEPQKSGWLFKVKLSHPHELQELLDETEHSALL